MAKPKIRVRATHNEIAAIAPTATRQMIADEAVPNLYLLINPGGSKTWLYDAAGAGRTRIKLSLGRFPTHGLADARAWAKARNEERASGENPIALKKARELEEKRAKANTVEAVFALWIAHKKAVKEAVKSLYGYERLFQAHIQPLHGKTPIAGFTKGNLRECLAPVLARGRAGSAERCRVMMGTFLKWCAYQDYVETNVAQAVQPTRTSGTGARELSVAELATLWRATEKMSEDDRDAIRLLMLTAQRKMSVLGARCNQYQGGVWLLLAGETKSGRDHPMLLSPVAREIFERRIAAAKRDKCANLFGEKIYPSMKARLCEDAAKVMEELTGGAPAHWSYHSIRKAVRTALGSDEMDEMGEVFSENVSEIVLNHSLGSLNRKYNRNRYQRQIGRALAALERLIVAEAAKQEAAAKS